MMHTVKMCQCEAYKQHVFMIFQRDEINCMLGIIIYSLTSCSMTQPAADDHAPVMGSTLFVEVTIL